jgi:hypothetical protein
MHKKVISLLFLLSLAFFGAAQAQGELPLSLVEADLWPEFDRPTMLVIYRITLSPQAALPAELRLRLPTAAGAPNAVASKQPDGSLITIPYTQEAAGEWTWLVFQAPSPELQIEYYDPDLVKDGSSRHFVYTWPGDYAVESFNVEVQQPVGASEMRIKPGMADGKPGSDGLMYYQLDVGQLQEGQPVEITVDYQKTGDELSANSAPIEPSGPLTGASTGRLSMTQALPWVLGFLGVTLIVGGGVWYWLSGRGKAQEERPPRPRHRPSARAEPLEEAGGHVYCHQCGKRASSGDLFCRACGTQLRIG